MGKQCIFLVFLSLAILARAQMQQTPEKVTQLHFYVQDILNGPTPTNIVVASANSSSTSPTSFGLVAVLDDPIRLMPSPTSEIVGRAQGFFAFASLEETSLHMSFDIVFTKTPYNGSVLNVVGRNPYTRNYRELSVVGGNGAFKLARGIIGIRTVSFDNSTGNAFFEYNVTVYHH